MDPYDSGRWAGCVGCLAVGLACLALDALALWGIASLVRWALGL